MRRGISMLEVLISIFVILVGLLGIVAMIPVGHSSMMKAVQHDRSAALGRMAANNIQVADMLDADRWCNADGTDFDETVTGTTAFVIDPLYAASNATVPGVNWVPLAPTASDPMIMPRLSLYGIGTTMMSLPVADRTFRGGDDLIFDRTDRERRPFAASDGVQSKGEYSWIATVNPSLASNDLPYADKPTYSVSVAVFRSRDFEHDPAAVPVTFDGTGLGGGDVTLDFPAGDAIPAIGSDRWILLHSPAVAMWYRVVYSEQDDVDPSLLRTFLAGPDWPQYVDGTGTMVPVTATAILFDGVVGVFSRVIER